MLLTQHQPNECLLCYVAVHSFIVNVYIYKIYPLCCTICYATSMCFYINDVTDNNHWSSYGVARKQKLITHTHTHHMIIIHIHVWATEKNYETHTNTYRAGHIHAILIHKRSPLLMEHTIFTRFD